jgi:uncharacterized membrane protein
MKTNQEYKNAALAALKGNWAPAVLATVVFFLIASLAYTPATVPTLTGAVDPAEISAMASAGDVAGVMGIYSQVMRWNSLSSLLSIFLVSVVTIGFYNAFLRLLRNGDNRLTSNMFGIAFKNYWHKVWGFFLMGLFLCLWSLLLVIPGIIKAFSYAMTPYILEDYPELSANDAIDLSRAMMKGRKFDLFWLCLSFIGWGILCILTAGIGFLWLIPYMETATAAFYEDVKADYEIKGGLI